MGGREVFTGLREREECVGREDGWPSVGWRLPRPSGHKNLDADKLWSPVLLTGRGTRGSLWPRQRIKLTRHSR